MYLTNTDSNKRFTSPKYGSFEGGGHITRRMAAESLVVKSKAKVRQAHYFIVKDIQESLGA
jgi:hypothetical protein